MRKGIAFNLPFFVVHQDGTPYTNLTANDIEIYIIKDNGPVIELTQDAEELNRLNYPGWYTKELSASNMDADVIVVTIHIDDAVVSDVVITTDEFVDSADIQLLEQNIEAYGQANWKTATGFATATNVTNAKNAIINEGNTNWLTATGFATPADIPTVSAIQDGLATVTDVSVIGNTIISHGDEFWTGGGEGSGITVEEVWNYEHRTLTEGSINPEVIAQAVTTYNIINNEDEGAPKYSLDTLIRTMCAWNRGLDTITLLKSDGVSPMNTLSLTEDSTGAIVEVK